MKLKRLIVRDIEINPHINPDAEPVPKAESYSEPTPVPMPVDPPIEVPPPEPVETFSKEPPEEQPVEIEEPKPEAKLEPESVAKPEAKPPPKRSRHRKSRIIFPLILIIGSLLYGAHILFDPLRLKPAPIVPRDIPIRALSSDPVETAPDLLDASLEISTTLPEGAEPNVQDYLDRIARLPMEASYNPEGVFINSVFYAEGMPLNPALGLKVDSVYLEAGNQFLLITDREGNGYPIPVP